MKTTTARLRAFTELDYPAWVAGSNQCYPDYPWSVEEARHQDDKWDHTRFFKTRIVAEEDGRIVGSVDVNHRPSRFHPDRYGFDVWVLPDRRRRGHGSALHEAGVAVLRERNALAATSGVKESMTDGVTFTVKRGWAEVKRDWESRLVVAGFDFDRFAGATKRVTGQGIRITTYADELARDAGAPRKAFELTDLCRRDVPAMDAPTDITFEEWRQDWVDGPSFLADAFFIAIDRAGRWLGMSNLQRSIEDPSFIWQGLTGVRREARGTGLAMALKLETVRCAQRLGSTTSRPGMTSGTGRCWRSTSRWASRNSPPGSGWSSGCAPDRGLRAPDSAWWMHRRGHGSPRDPARSIQASRHDLGQRRRSARHRAPRPLR